MKFKNFCFYITFFVASLFCDRVKADETYVIETGQFDKIRVVDNVNVVYRCLPDSTGFAQFTGKERFNDAFIISNKNGNLKIQVNTEDVDAPDLPVLYIYSDFLLSAENSSILSLTIENPAPCAELKLTQVGNGSITALNVDATKVSASLNTGNGTLNVAGKCETADFRMVGTGLISADRLKAKSVHCKILGTGSIGCWPLETLDVKGLGATKIYYKGNPTVKKSGGGKLFQLPASDEDDDDYTDEDIPEIKTYPVANSNNTSPQNSDTFSDEEEDDDAELSAGDGSHSEWESLEPVGIVGENKQLQENEKGGEETLDIEEEEEYQTIVTADD